jgi:hypothetical protein
MCNIWERWVPRNLRWWLDIYSQMFSCLIMYIVLGSITRGLIAYVCGCTYLWFCPAIFLCNSLELNSFGRKLAEYELCWWSGTIVLVGKWEKQQTYHLVHGHLGVKRERSTFLWCPQSDAYTRIVVLNFVSLRIYSML